jgi:hypothetical protein
MMWWTGDGAVVGVVVEVVTGTGIVVRLLSEVL